MFAGLGFFSKAFTPHLAQPRGSDGEKPRAASHPGKAQIYERSFRFSRVAAEVVRDVPTDDLKPRSVSVSMTSGVAVDVEIAPCETIWQLKQRFARAFGISPERQRLLWRGIPMPDDRSVAACRIPHGGELRLVERLKMSSSSALAPPAPRGLLMIAGNRAWRPEHTSKPTLPIVASDVYRPFAMAIEFESVADFAAFKEAGIAAQELGGKILMLEVNARDGDEVVTELVLDDKVVMARVASLGNIKANTRREAWLCLRPNVRKRVWVVTGDELGHGTN